MIENISDYLSIISIALIPISLLTLLAYKRFKNRKAKLLSNREKYFREW
ncbi:MAG: hypothetical protein RSG07_04415 [Erysipelotrichaceae bacterium]